MSTGAQRPLLVIDTWHHGIRLLIGPFPGGVTQALDYTVRNFPSHGPIQHRFRPLASPELSLDQVLMSNAIAMLAEHPEPPALARLRAAINPDRTPPAENRQVAALLAHLAEHRPVTLYLRDCQDNECEHAATAVDRRCHRPTPAGLVCWHCSAIIQPGGDRPDTPLAACTIEWPCQVVRVLARAHDCPLEHDRDH